MTEVLLSAAMPQRGERVLDIGCGAGAQTFALANAVGADGAVTGIDFSAPLLERAEERRDKVGVGNVTFRLGDAAVESFPAGAFDLAASRFGVMFFEEPVAAFRSIAAALRSGGRIAFVAWQAQEHNPWFALPHTLAVERLGEGAPSSPDAPGPMAFRDADRVLRILSEAGLTDCSAEHVTTELHYPGSAQEAASSRDPDRSDLAPDP